MTPLSNRISLDHKTLGGGRGLSVDGIDPLEWPGSISCSIPAVAPLVLCTGGGMHPHCTSHCRETTTENPILKGKIAPPTRSGSESKGRGGVTSHLEQLPTPAEEHMDRNA